LALGVLEEVPLLLPLLPLELPLLPLLPLELPLELPLLPLLLPLLLLPPLLPLELPLLLPLLLPLELPLLLPLLPLELPLLLPLLLLELPLLLLELPLLPLELPLLPLELPVPPIASINCSPYASSPFWNAAAASTISLPYTLNMDSNDDSAPLAPRRESLEARYPDAPSEKFLPRSSVPQGSPRAFRLLFRFETSDVRVPARSSKFVPAVLRSST
jgi:hypothetical protein